MNRFSTTIKELFVCQICSRKFTTKGGRTNHLKICSKKISSLNSQSVSNESEANALNPTVELTSQQPIPRDATSVPEAIRIWGPHTENDLFQIVSAVYEEVVHWQKNLFLVPTGACGKKFIKEIRKFIDYFNCNSEFFSDISLKILMIMPSLLLQKPGYKSKSKMHANVFRGDWKNGKMETLTHSLKKEEPSRRKTRILKTTKETGTQTQTS